MEDVEVCVVARVVFVRVKRARRVEGERIGVDVELAAHLSRGDVDALRGRAGGTLLAVGGVGEEVEREVLAEVERGVQVGRVAVHAALLVPSRVFHDAQRGVIGSLVGAGGHADGVVLHHAEAEELVEPVGVALLGGLQVGVARFRRVGQPELPRVGVVGVDQVPHLAVDAAVGGVVDPVVARAGEVEPPLLGHFLVDVHLVLRVHDVEVVVRRLHAHGELAGIVDAALSGFSFLGGHDDDAGHGPCAVDGRGRAVFQNLEALDVVGVETGDGGTDEGLHVARGESVGAHVDGVFHDDAVHHPQRLAAAEDGGGAAHADLGRRAEGAAHVLYRHAGGPSLKGAADVRHTVDFHLLGIELHGGAGEEPLVHLLHTGDDHFLQVLALGLQGDVDARPDGHGLLDEPDVGDFEPLGTCGDVLDGKFSVQVGRRAEGGALHPYAGPDERQAVLAGVDRARGLLRLRPDCLQGHADEQAEHEYPLFHILYLDWV